MAHLRKIFLTAVFALACIASYAQNSFSVSLKLVDEKTGEAVGFATTSLTVKGEKEAAKYALTNSEGEVSLTKVRKGTYILKAELMGYKAHEQEITVDKAINLGTIKMKEDVEVLDAASVSAVGNPIIVKKDTIEYNASLFRVSDNDMLEDLLKKLPGVEVAADGTVTANGETINKITIDGKTFFLDDPQLAVVDIVEVGLRFRTQLITIFRQLKGMLVSATLLKLLSIFVVLQSGKSGLRRCGVFGVGCHTSRCGFFGCGGERSGSKRRRNDYSLR